MKSFLVFCILFVVGIRAQDCNFDNEQLKVAHSEFKNNAYGWDFATYKAELKKLTAQFVEWRDSIDPKCFAVAPEPKIVIDMFGNSFQFLDTIDESQKNIILAPEYLKCLKAHGNEIRTCINDGFALLLLQTCDDGAEPAFMNCWKKTIKDQCEIANFEELLNFGKHIFKYSKDKNLCGQSHIFVALMETSLF